MSHLFLECAVRAALLIAGTAITLYALRVKNAAAKHTIWTGVLALMLLLPLWTAWGPKAALRLLPPLPEKTAGQLIEAATAISIPAPVLQSNMPLPEVSQPTARPLVITWQHAALGIYLLGLCMLLLRLAIGTLRARKLIRQAQLHDGKHTSSMCAAPVTVGFINPTVILPDHWTAWPQAQLDAVLTHENEHARRRDPLVQWLALLNRAFFWFHPAAWWLERELSTLAEQACDDVVLSRGHNPREYAECLIDVARSVMRSQARLNIAGMAMPGSSLPQRIRQIIERGPAPRISRVRMSAVAAACAITGTLFAAVTLDHAKLNASAQSAKIQTEPAPVTQAAPTKFILGDLEIQGDVHDRDAVRNRILKAWKDREYADAYQLADEVMHNGVRDDFQRRGYFTVVAVDRVAQPLGLTDGKQRIRVIVPVTEGDQFRLGTLAIQNYDQNRPLAITASNLRDSLRSGDLLNVDEIRRAIEKLTSAYSSAGYSDVTVVPSFIADHLHHRVDMTLRIIEGPHTVPGQPVIERIEFEGNRRMRSETLQSLILTRTGVPFNRDALSLDFQTLSSTQYFENVRLEVQDSPDRPNGKIVIFHLVERPVIRRIEYHGIKSITQSDLLARFNQRGVGLVVESQLNPATIKRAEVALQELLAEHGHPLATVKSSYQRIPGTNAVSLTVTVDENPAAALPQTPATFESASVKRTQTRGRSTSNVLLTPDDVYAPPAGGVFSTTSMPLSDYMRFAYKDVTILGLPDWARTDRFDIQANTGAESTKDQLRLMLQALLADRFKLSVHKETQQSPVYALVLAKPGATGPQLQPNNGSCSSTPADVQALNTLPRLPAPAAAGAPRPTIACGTLMPIPPSAPGRMHIAGQKVPLSLLATMATNPASGLDRRVVDHTGLSGTFDMSFEWAPRINGPGFTADPGGPTFFEALEKELGFKPEPQMEPLDVVVIDHVEQPSDN